MSTAATVAQWLAQARTRGLDRLDAQLLIGRVLGQSRTWLLAHDDTLLTPAQAIAVDGLLVRRSAGEPLAYLLGEKEFHGLTLWVNADVLVPRPDTEVLVDWALELVSGVHGAVDHPDVVDMGTGSGAIALAVKHRHAAAQLTATDLSIAALAVARVNAERLALAVELRQGSWWQAVQGRRFHLALSNPPYIAGDDPHLAALAHEPAGALSPGGDGLEALRQLAAGAPAHLHPGAWLLLEHGHDQADVVQQMLLDAGLSEVQTRPDLAGLPRCTGGHL